MSSQDANKLDYEELFQPTPCEAFNCDHQELCRKESLSCDAYNGYVQSGKPSLHRLILRKRENSYLGGVKHYYDFIPTREHSVKLFKGVRSNGK